MENAAALLPDQQALTVCFAHVAYQMEATWAKHNTGLRAFQAWTAAELATRIGTADVLVVSGPWGNELRRPVQAGGRVGRQDGRHRQSRGAQE